MALKNEFKQNTFCWVELEAPDVEAARNFYAPLFGWSFEEKAVAGGDEPYVIARKGGDYAAGILRGKNGRWVSNIAVADVDATVAKARNLGFFVVEEPRDWGGKGRAATLRDLEGAEFALWQAKEPHTAERNTAGSFCWTELLTNDREGMQKLYADLFGWQPKTMPDMPHYVMFYLGDTMVAGLMEITKEMAGAKPSWFVYFSVEDCDATAKKAEAARARSLLAPRDIPNVGRFSMLADPFGAAFGIIKLRPAVGQGEMKTA